MQKQLFRSRKNRMISGVSGGLAEYFDIDPVIIRAIFIIATLGWGISLIVYIVLWIIVPNAPEIISEMKTEIKEEKENVVVDEEYLKNLEEKRSRRRVIGGIILICLGGLFIIDNFTPWIGFGDFWPLALIAFGTYILFKNIFITDLLN